MIEQTIETSNGAYTFDRFLTDVVEFGLRVVDADKLPRQLEMATEDAVCRTLVVFQRQNSLAKFTSAKVAIRTIVGRLSLDESVTLTLRDPYGNTGDLIVGYTGKRADCDGFEWHIDEELRTVLYL